MMIENYLEARGARKSRDEIGAALTQGAMTLPGDIMTILKKKMDVITAELKQVPESWAMTNAEISTLLIKEPAQSQDTTTNNTEVSGMFSGRILDVSEGVAVQNINRSGDTALHAVSKLSTIVNAGDIVTIRYKNGVGVVNGLELAGKGVGR